MPPLQFQIVASGRVGALADLAIYGVDHAGVRMPQQQRAMPAEVIYVLVAVSVPFPRALGALYIYGMRLDISEVPFKLDIYCVVF